MPLLCPTQRWRRRWTLQREAAAMSALAAAGQPVPRLFAWGQESRLLLPRRSVLLCEALHGAEALRERIWRHRDAGTLPALAPALAAVGHRIAALHAAGWIHGDLSVRNLMLSTESPAPPQVWLVDLSAARRAAHRPAALRADLYRLAKTARKAGLDEPGVATLLDAACPADSPRIRAAAATIKAIRNRYLRMARYHVWVRLGV